MSQQFRLSLCVAALLGGAIAVPAWAHKPVAVDGGPTTAATAYIIEDAAVSQVGYHEATPEKPQLWFTFEGEAGFPLYLQLGVPYIARYEGLRPAMALIGPGLPAIDLSFEIPAGCGGVLFDMREESPVLFHETFTGTDSWQLPAVEPVLPATGTYYVVGFLPEAEGGKFWMAIGTEERFGFRDILTLPVVLFQVRAFHEVGPVGGILFWAFFGGLAVLLLLLGLILL